MEKTAVEWLFNQLEFDESVSMDNIEEIFQQSKAMEKEQSECICVNVIERILNESEQGREINSKQIFEDVYHLTFKSE